MKQLAIIKKLGVFTRKSHEDWGEIVNKEIHLFLMETPEKVLGPADEATGWYSLDEAFGNMKHPEEAKFLISVRTELS